MRRWSLLAAVSLLAQVVFVPVAAAAPTPTLRWEVAGCHETVAFHPAPRFGSDAVLVVLAYRCDTAVIEGSKFKNFAVSEISVFRTSKLESTLLRQVTDNRTLWNNLRALGVRDAFLGEITYTVGLTDVEVDVEFGDTKYRIHGPAAYPPPPAVEVPENLRTGASYTYAGNRGTVQVSYENIRQTVTAAAPKVTAVEDPALSEWLGGGTATCTGMTTRGDWIGTAALL